MPFCNKCGTRIEQGTYCGECLPNVVQQPRNAAEMDGKIKKKKKAAWIVFPVAAVLILAVAAVAIVLMLQRQQMGQPVLVQKEAGEKEAVEETVEELPYSGTCENGLSWELDAATGKLTIQGSGSIADYTDAEPAPWSVHSDKITSIELQSGITAIGDYAFAGCAAVTQVSIPEGVTAIGTRAFAGCSALPQITLPESLTQVEQDAFADCTSLSEIYHTGSLKQWQSVQIDDGNQELIKCTIDFAKEDPKPQSHSSGKTGGSGTGGAVSGSQPVSETESEPEAETEPETTPGGMVSGGRYDEMPIVTIEDGKVVVRPNPNGGLIED